jgi:membrane-bound lytic murein transglycosylase D
MRAGRYRPMIERILNEEGVPADLIYLAQAESGFEPAAVSRASARGMWQFMMSRAEDYGLRRDWWVDDRQDPEKATRAAARHLRDLYKQFGDWYLAMAAYNSGPGTVQAAVGRTGYADFWELYRRGVLPKETKNYVPIIVAVTIMAKNPAQYGLENIVPDPPMQFDTVKIDYPVDLRLVAECVDTSVTTLQEMNPSLLRLTTPKKGHFDLRLPAGTKDKFEEAIAAIPVDKRVWWRYHKVQAGDTLLGIAKKYHASASSIAQVNNLESGDDLPVDDKLIIPVAGHGREDGTIVYSRRVVRYTVRPGDTALSVADDWGVPVSKLRAWNGIKGNHLKRGRVLLIHRPLDARDDTSAEAHATRHSRSHAKRTSTLAARSHRTTASKANSTAEPASVGTPSTSKVAALNSDKP